MSEPELKRKRCCQCERVVFVSEVGARNESTNHQYRLDYYNDAGLLAGKEPTNGTKEVNKLYEGGHQWNEPTLPYDQPCLTTLSCRTFTDEEDPCLMIEPYLTTPFRTLSVHLPSTLTQDGPVRPHYRI